MVGEDFAVAGEVVLLYGGLVGLGVEEARELGYEGFTLGGMSMRCGIA